MTIQALLQMVARAQEARQALGVMDAEYRDAIRAILDTPTADLVRQCQEYAGQLRTGARVFRGLEFHKKSVEFDAAADFLAPSPASGGDRP